MLQCHPGPIVVLQSQSASVSLTPCVLQLFEYILEYLRTVRFGEPDHSLALPADQTELAQIVREVSKHLTSLSRQPQYRPSLLVSAAYFGRSCVCCACMCSNFHMLLLAPPQCM